MAILAAALVVPSARLPNALAIPTSTFTKDHKGDPSNDVQEFYSSNKTPVVANGNWVFSTRTGEVDLWEVHSKASGSNVQIWLVVHGSFPRPMWSNMSFVFDLYTDAQDLVHYSVNYTGGSGTMWLYSNRTGFTPVDITGNATISGPNPSSDDTLTITVDTALIPNITAWDIDASSQEIGPVYTYRDYIYQVPGHPGTSPSMISGHVYEAGTNNTISGANVSVDVGGYYTLTDATGAYTLFLAPGTYNITVTKDGYEATTTLKTMGAGQITQNYNLYLTPSGPLQRLGTMGLLIILAVVLSGVFLFLFLLLKRRRPSRSSPAWDSNQGRPGAP